MRIISTIVISVLLLISAGCDTALPPDVDAALLKEPLRLTVHSNGSPTTSVTLPNDGPLVTALRRIVTAKHPSAWKTQFVTYAPGTMVYGESITLNIHGNSIIVGYRINSDRSRQREVKLTAEEAEQIRREIERIISG